MYRPELSGQFEKDTDSLGRFAAARKRVFSAMRGKI
jgi:hypothetical protein